MSDVLFRVLFQCHLLEKIKTIFLNFETPMNSLIEFGNWILQKCESKITLLSYA